MAYRFRALIPALLALVYLGLTQFTAAAIDGVREINLNLQDLVYDPFT